MGQLKKINLIAGLSAALFTLAGCYSSHQPMIVLDDGVCTREIQFTNQYPYPVEIDFFDWTSAIPDADEGPIVTHYFVPGENDPITLERQGYYLAIYSLQEDGTRDSLVGRRNFSFRCSPESIGELNVLLSYRPPPPPPRIEDADEPWLYTPPQRARGEEGAVLEEFLARFPDSGVTEENFCSYVTPRHDVETLLQFEQYSVDHFKAKILGNVETANRYFTTEESLEELPEGESAVTIEEIDRTDNPEVLEEWRFTVHESLRRRWNNESPYAGLIRVTLREVTDRYERRVLRKSLELNRGESESGQWALLEENYPVGTTEFIPENLMSMTFSGSNFASEDYFVDIYSPRCFPSDRLWGHYMPRFFGSWAGRWRPIVDQNHINCLIHTIGAKATVSEEAYIRRQVLDLFSEQSLLNRENYGLPGVHGVLRCQRDLNLRTLMLDIDAIEDEVDTQSRPDQNR